jgi:hypothetical protein
MSEVPGGHLLALTRDSVGMADDVRSPHRFLLAVAADADAVMVANAILAAGYPARSGRHPTWSFDWGDARVLLGHRDDRPFVDPQGGCPAGRALDIHRLHLTWLGQSA